MSFRPFADVATVDRDQVAVRAVDRKGHATGKALIAVVQENACRFEFFTDGTVRRQLF